MESTSKGDISAHEHCIFLLILPKGISQIHSIQAFPKFSKHAFLCMHSYFALGSSGVQSVEGRGGGNEK